MRVQRTYTLPNCTLTVTGIANEEQVMTILTGFEFSFQHDQSRIKGGRDLLEDLIKTVNIYSLAFQKGQEQISPVSQLVTLEANSPDTHRLTVKHPEHPPVEIVLNTVQLFDLMDSLDRLCMDELTLPDLKLDFQAPIAFRRFSQFNWGSLVAGIILITVSTIGLYNIPTPEPPRPTPPPPTRPR
ncbi:MAG: DUF4335 domain-containing protein [Pseudanabaenaceae cyanobacterium]